MRMGMVQTVVSNVFDNERTRRPNRCWFCGNALTNFSRSGVLSPDGTLFGRGVPGAASPNPMRSSYMISVVIARSM